jgi:lysophospholipase L1-like esterase
MKNIIPLLLLVSVCLAFSGKPKVRIFIAGDSTAQTYDTTKTIQRGWGQELGSFFGDEVEVVNRAKAGRSTKSFIDEGRWDSIMKNVKKGDYVLIQFGHNDTSTKPERHASPKDYRANLIKFIEETRAHKAHPVLLTSIVMRTFKDKVLVDDRLKSYPGIMRAVAREYNVPLIDANVMTRDLVLSLGDEASKKLYMWCDSTEDKAHPKGDKDDTHTRYAGAHKIAEFVVQGMQDLKIKDLTKYLLVKNK